MKTQAVRTFKILILVATSCSLVSCALFFGSGDDDVGKKSTADKYAEPRQPYRRINVTSADAVWQSTRTGNTIAVNSLCSKTEAQRNLETLDKTILSGIEELKIRSQSHLTLDGVAADRTLAYGQMEGVPIEVDLVTARKGTCTYDLAYVAREKTFSDEHDQFNQFVEGFKVP